MAIQIVVVGLGARGQAWIREIRKMSQFELAGCVDSDAETLRRSARTAGIPDERCFSDLKSALEKSRAVAILVATSADCHVEACEIGISRGLGVLVEKPFTLTLNEAKWLVAKAERAGTPLIVAQNYRYMRSFRTARELILRGALGRVGMVVLQYYRVPHEMASSLARLPHSVLWGIGVHHLDALQYILEKKITRVLAEDFTLPWGQLPPGASLQVLLELEGGTRGLYSATYESSGHEFFELGQEFYARFVGENGTLHIFQRWLILCEKGKLPRLVRRGSRKVTEEQILLAQFEKALTAGQQSDSSGLNNLQTMAVIEACILSSSEQRWINPQELLNASD